MYAHCRSGQGNNDAGSYRRARTPEPPRNRRAPSPDAPSRRDQMATPASLPPNRRRSNPLVRSPLPNFAPHIPCLLDLTRLFSCSLVEPTDSHARDERYKIMHPLSESTCKMFAGHVHPVPPRPAIPGPRRRRQRPPLHPVAHLGPARRPAAPAAFALDPRPRLRLEQGPLPLRRAAGEPWGHAGRPRAASPHDPTDSECQRAVPESGSAVCDSVPVLEHQTAVARLGREGELGENALGVLCAHENATGK